MPDETLPPSNPDATSAPAPVPLESSGPAPTTPKWGEASVQPQSTPSTAYAAGASTGHGGATPPPSTPPTHPPSAAPPAGPRRGRTSAALLLVAGLVGGLAGGIIVSTTQGDQGNGSVNVSESSSGSGPAVIGNGVSIPRLVNQAVPKVVSIDVKAQGMEDQGTGMIISADGMVVTNNHVISAALSGSATITVTRSGTTTKMPATLVGADPSNDVALLKINDAKDLPYVTFGNSNKLDVGDAVVAIGNALGLEAGTPTVTSGIVSALGRTVTASNGSGGTETIDNMIQTDAAINPGNSGGPLIDSNGYVIGMNTAVAGSSGDGTSAQNIGFAIPSAKIQRLLPDLAKGGVLQNAKAYLGVQIATLTQSMRQQYGFKPESGAVVLATVPDGPAASAGIRQEDVIVRIGSNDIASAEDVSGAMGKLKPGQSVQVEVYRGASRQTFTVKLGTAPVTQSQG